MSEASRTGLPLAIEGLVPFAIGLAAPLGMAGMNLSLYMGLLWSLWVFASQHTVTSSLRPILIASVLVFASGIVSALVQPDLYWQSVRSSLSAVHLLACIPGFYMARRAELRQYFVRGLVLGLGVSVLYSFAQWGVLHGWWPHFFTVAKKTTSLNGFFSNAITQCGVLFMLAGILSMLEIPWKKGRLALILGVFAVIVFSRERMYTALTALTSPLWAKTGRQRGQIVFALVLLIAATTLLFPSMIGRFKVLRDFSSPYSSQSVHLTLAGDAIEEWQSAPLLGHGPGSFKRSFKIRHPDWIALGLRYNHAHNQYLHAMAETGLLGLISMLVFLGTVGRVLWQRKAHTNYRPLLIMTITIVGAGLTDVPFFDAEVIQVYSLGVGVWLGLSQNAATVPTPPAARHSD